MRAQRTRRAATVAVGALLGASLLLAGCTRGTPDDQETTSAAAASVRPESKAYIACMVAEGAVMTTNPDTDTVLDKDRTPVEVGIRAEEKCASVRPSPTPRKVDPEAAKDEARCMREHGVPEYPDPDPSGRQVDLDDALARKLQEDPTALAAYRACVAPPGGDGGPAY
ncbi:hypothetical protein [Kitasatospora sp. NPDC057198]|uniref:hypothetical protein n=1 Tax=Kitasatospora sp. NPDC057198 TaxID=3346046 RepID=UPI003638B2B0